MANRSRRNNLRLRGLPETAGEGPLQDLLHTILKPLLPDMPDHLWHIERAHRALRARRADQNSPRDVIMRFFYFQTKEALLKKSRETPIR
ncbi:Hypothetical predicted protein, partial [Pelobates cultripes]